MCVNGSIVILVTVRQQLGGGGVAGDGPAGGTGPLGTFGRPDQGGDGLAADLADVRASGNGVQRVQVVPGDHVGDFLAVAWERLPQMRGHGQMADLAVPPGKRVVGDLAQQVLGEAVAAPLGRQRVRRHDQELAAQ